MEIKITVVTSKKDAEDISEVNIPGLFLVAHRPVPLFEKPGYAFD